MPPSLSVRTNRVLEAIREGRKAVGFQLSFPLTPMVEMMAGEGFDYLYIDGEHGAFTRRDIEETCRAAELSGLTVIGRVPRLDEAVIRDFLDSGVQGIVVPKVSTAAEARTAVSATFFAPKGERSFSSARATAYRADLDDTEGYFSAVNAEISLTVQIETRLGLDNIDDIAAVPGIDYLTIGKQDLTLGLGLKRCKEGFDPALHEAMARIQRALVHHGRPNRDDIMRTGKARDFIFAGARQYLGRST